MSNRDFILFVYPARLSRKVTQIEDVLYGKGITGYFGRVRLTDSTAKAQWEEMIFQSTIVIILSDKQSRQSKLLQCQLSEALELARSLHKNICGICGDANRFRYALQWIDWIIDTGQNDKIACGQKLSDTDNHSQGS